MFDKIKKIKENKVLNTIWNILYTLLFIVVVFLLIIVVMQRVTNNDITIGGIRMFSVETGSMVPVYNIGDVLIAKEIEPEEIKVGDDIVYKGEEETYSDKVITHRVKSTEKQEDGNYKIITQGVANDLEDPEINQTQVYGKVIYKVRTLGFLTRLTKNVYTFYFIIFIPIAMIIFRIIKNMFGGDDEEDDEQNGENNKNN